MNTSDLSKMDLLDVLFRDRNKSYGAYYLRRTYYKRLLYALFIVIGIAALASASYIFEDQLSSKKEAIHVVDVNIKEIQDIPPDIPPPPEPKEQPKVVEEVKKFTEQILVKKEELRPDTKPVDLEELANTNIGAVDVEGVKPTSIAAPPTTSTSGVGDDYVFEKVEIEPEPNGGKEGWARYLRRNLNAAIGADNGAPPGRYTVVISFIVERDGRITDAKIVKKQGYGMDQEALRVIKQAPAWTPGQQNGRAVRAAYSQSVTFVVDVN